MKKYLLILFATLLCTNKFLFAQSLPVPSHIVIVIEENRAYEEILGDSSADAPYINSLTTDTDAALFTQSYALTHPSQPNYIMLFSGDDQGVTTDGISSSQFTTCNLGASLLASGFSFKAYSEELPATGSLVTSSGNYARRHCPWTNWQGSSTNAIPADCNLPYTLFPTNYDSLPTVSFVIPNLVDDMHSSSIGGGDTWLKNNLNNYITWAKTHNSLLILTFDEDDDSDDNHIPTIFIGQMVKGGSYSDTIIHYNILHTIEDIYGLPDCANSDSTNAITEVWRSNTTGINQLPVNSNQLSVYPNPTTGEINIVSTKTIDAVTVTNLLGQMVLKSPSGNLGVTQFTFELKEDGTYFVTVTSGDETTTRKIIISK